MKGVIFSVLSLILILLVVGCAPKAAPVSQALVPTPKVEAASPQPQVPAKEAWAIEWERMLEDAKKEGTVVFYSTTGGVMRQAVSGGFRARYGLAVENVSGKGAELAAKLISERNAGIYVVDIYSGGSSTAVNQFKPEGILDPLEPALILPEVVDPKLWYGGEIPWVDSAHTILAFLGFPISILAINTNLVKPEEIKSYRDLLNPKWKGKILMNDPTLAGIGPAAFAMMGWHIMNMDYWREMAKQEPVIIRDQRLLVEWLAHGKYPVLFFPSSPPMAEFRRAGAPIAWVTPSEGTYLSSGDGNVALINRAPHPNAARLFINWLLSREGQTIFSRAYDAQCNRLDVLVEGLDPYRIRQPGAKYFLGADKEEFRAKQPEHMRIAKEIFGHLMK